MNELELLLWAFAALLFAGAVFGVGVAAVAAWTTTRLLRTVASTLAPVSTGPPAAIRDVETRLAGLASAQYVDSGVVRRVVPESRRGRGRGLGRLTRTPGVRFDVALPVEGRERAVPVWVPLPDRLTGTTALERVAAACGVSPDRISDAVGEEVPVRRVDDRWVVGVPAASAGASAARDWAAADGASVATNRL
jgi:hypothetical protein